MKKPVRVDKYSNENLRARKARILQTARTLIGSKGLEGLTMRELADRSGVALATLYNIYGSRDVLIHHAVNDFFDNILELRLTKAKNKNALGRMLLLLELIARYVMDSPEYARVVVAMYFKLDRGQGMHGMLYTLAHTELTKLLEEMRHEAHYAEWVSIDLLADEMTEQVMWRLFQWTRGVIPDRYLVDALTFGVLQIFAGSTHSALNATLQSHLRKSTRRLVKLRLSNMSSAT